jgi:hypothetical protein
LWAGVNFLFKFTKKEIAAMEKAVDDAQDEMKNGKGIFHKVRELTFTDGKTAVLGLITYDVEE